MDLLTFQTAKTLRFVELGNLELKNAPSIIEFERPIINYELKLLGRKDKALTMFVIDTRAISTDWYLYAYIDSPLTTPDGKHSLPGSLVYVDENNDIKTLSETPTLIFSGTANSGTTKTTEISWDEGNGILYKVIEPLYNGETYSTEINWILSDEKLE